MSSVIRTTAALGLSAWVATIPASGQTTTPAWADPELVSINQRPPRAALGPLGPPEDVDRWRLSLNGEWRFLLLSDAADLPQDIEASLAASRGWSSVRVPGSWQAQGFGAAVLTRGAAPNPVYTAGGANPTGVFVRRFALPPAWSGRQVVLRLTRARSSVRVRLNGNDVGYSENVEAGAEFVLNRHLVEGENRLTLIVTQWSTSSELNGVHWTDAGLLDDVDLVAVPAVHLRDLSADAGFNPDSGDGTLGLVLRLASSARLPTKGLRVEAELMDPQRNIVSRRSRRDLAVGNDESEVTLSLQVAEAEPWSPDSPSLYTLELRLLDAAGSVLQRSRLPIGFRTVEFGRDGLRLNGHPLILRGVSLDADVAARVTDHAAIVQHLRLMKQAGINALRLPVSPSPRWYEALDSHGLVTLHELSSPTATAGAGALERATAMVEAAKNHPSTLAWVWRGAGGGAGAQARSWLRAHDRHRAVLPDRNLALMASPRAWQFARQARDADRPLVLWPFATLLGNSGGGLDRFWRVVEREPQAIGGFLTRWMVSTDISRPSETAPEPGDAVARGLLDAEGRPLPAHGEVATLFRPLRFQLVDAATASFRLVNRSHSFDTSGSKGLWTLRQDGSVIAAGRLPRLGVGAGESVRFRVPGLPPRDAAAEYHLSLRLFAGSEIGDGDGRITLAAAQFPLPSNQSNPVVPFAGEIPALAFDEDGVRVELGTRDVTFRVDRTTGTLRYLALRGRPMVDGLVVPSLWRLPTQQEKASGLAAVDQRLQGVFSAPPAAWVGRRVSAGSYSSVGEYTVLDEGVMRIQTTAWGTGATELNLHWLGEPGTPDPPRLGVSLPLTGRAASVEWFGRGPGESYRNRLSGTEIGRWEAPLPMPNPYHWQQAHGQRTELRWLTVWFIDGSGLLVVTPPSSSFSVVDRAARPYLELDVQHRGVGGERDDAVPARRARIAPGEYRATFLLLPIPAGSEPQRLFRANAPTEGTAAALQSPVRTPPWSLDHLARRRPLNLVESDADAPPTKRSPFNDGWTGSIDAWDGTWKAIGSLPAEITIDLEGVETVRRLRLGVLAAPTACADLPAGVEFSYSTDRRRWISLEPVRPVRGTAQVQRQWLTRDLLGRPVRWVRARLLDPETTCRTGAPNRVLVDELVVE